MKTETSLFEKFKETGRHGIIFGLGSVLGPLIGFILIPIYTTYLKTSDYGILQLVLTTARIFIIIFALGLTSGLLRSYYDYEDLNDRRTVISTAIIIVAISCCILLILGIFLSKYLSILIFGSAKYEIYFIIIVLSSVFGILKGLPFTVLQVRKKSISYVIFQISFLILGVILVIYLLVIKNWGVKGVLIGYLISAVVSFLILYFYIRKDIILSFSKLEARKMIHFGVPLSLAGLTAFVFTYIDVFIMNYYLSLSDVGLYALGYQFGLLIYMMLIAPSKLILNPMFLSVKDDSNAKQFYGVSLTYMLFLGAGLFLLISLLSKEVLQIIANKEYWDAYMVIPLIALTYLIWSTRPVIGFGIVLERKTRITAWYFFIGAIINVILNLVLIPEYGMMGAAYATLISFIVMIIICFYYGSIKYLKINYEWIRILKLSLATALIFIIGYFVIIDNLYKSIAFKVIIIFSYPFVLYLMRFFTANEIKRIKQVFRYILFKLKLKHGVNRR